MSIDTALTELRAIGFTVIEGVLDEPELGHARAVLDLLYGSFDPRVDKPMLDISAGAAGDEILRRSTEFNWASVLAGKDDWFRSLMRRSPVFDVVSAVLGQDCILSSMNSLEPLEGRGAQALHRDEGPIGPEGPVVVNSLWAIDDIVPANGATRFVPGTHTTAELVDATDPRIRQVSAPAGSVVVFDGHILHAASRNLDGARRRAVHVYYTKMGRKRQTDWGTYLSAEVLARFEPEQRRMVGL